MSRRQTCHSCPKLGRKDIAPGATVAYCKHDGAVVPHHSDFRAGTITYWSVPETCPLPDTEVEKRYARAPASEWVTESIS